LRSVTIEQFIRPEKGWSPEPNSTVEITARLRNRLPLVVDGGDTGATSDSRVASSLS